MTYIESKNIKIYPSGYRGNYTNGAQKISFDPESKLPVEGNMMKPYTALVTVEKGNENKFRGNLVVSNKYQLDPNNPAVNSAFEFIIRGHYIKLRDADTFFAANFASATNIYARIKLQDLGISDYDVANENNVYPNGTAAVSLTTYPTSGQITPSVASDNAEESFDVTNLDITSGDKTYFTAIEFTSIAQEGAALSADECYFNILTRSNTSEPFKVPMESVLILDGTNITTDNNGHTTNLSQKLITEEINSTKLDATKDAVKIRANTTVNADYLQLMHSTDANSDAAIKIEKNGKVTIINNSSNNGSVIIKNKNKESKVTINNASGNTNIAGTLDVGGDFKVGTNKFTVAANDGATAIKGNVSVNENKFTINASNGDTSIAGTLAAAGTLNINDGKFVVNSANGNLTVNSNRFTVDGSTGDTRVAGNFVIKDLNNQEKFSINVTNGNTNVTGTLTSAGKLTVSADGADITGNSKITGELEVTQKIKVDAMDNASTVNANLYGVVYDTGTNKYIKYRDHSSNSNNITSGSTSEGDIVYISQVAVDKLGEIDTTNTKKATLKKATSSNAGYIRQQLSASASDNFLNENGTWIKPNDFRRPISVKDTEYLSKYDTSSLNFKEGDNVTLSWESGSVKISAVDTTYGAKGNITKDSSNQFDLTTNVSIAGEMKSATLNTGAASTGAITASGNISTTGNISATGNLTASSCYTYSDRRLKENVVPLNYEKSILDLPVVTYDYINGPKNQIGCIAQDLQKLYPQLVAKNENGYLTVANDRLVYLLLEEVKLLKKEIDELKKNK